MRKKIGIFNSYLDSMGGGEKVSLALAEELSKNHSVSIIFHEEINLEKLGKYFQLDLSKVRLEVVDNRGFQKAIHKTPLIPQSLKNLINEYSQYRKLRAKDYDIFINNTFYSNLPNPGKKGVYMCMFPQKLTKEPTNNLIKIVYRIILNLLYRIILFNGKKQAVNTYDLITANSKYTQKYIKKYWDLESEIIYPICDSMALPNINKENIILNVGRFFGDRETAHHKRQDFLIDSFIKSDLHKKGWEFHLVGSVNRDKKTLDYILDLLSRIEGYPVYLHFNFPYGDLKKLFNRASIYWHATGYGSDTDKYPEKQEHFGMSTVEAMSANCVPIVINTAGQKESVVDGQNGFMWSNKKELIKKTSHVTKSFDGMDKLVKYARLSAEKFDKSHFAKQVGEIFAKLVS